MTIETSNGKKLLYVIEFQNTHKESVSTLTHKFLSAHRHFNPDKALLMNVRISARNSEWDLLSKLEIFRRWVILTCYYSTGFPSKTYWEFFCETESPFSQSDVKIEFLRQPIKVEKAPKGIKSDWEFCTNPIVLKKRQNYKRKADDEVPSEKYKKSPWDNINESAVDVHGLFGIGWPEIWGPFNCDNYGFAEVFNCSRECAICERGTSP